MSVISEDYIADNVTVIVEWTKQEDTVYCMFGVSPPVPVMFTGSKRRQLTISYNTEYNLSVIATAPCKDKVTTSIKLNYSKYSSMTVSI